MSSRCSRARRAGRAESRIRIEGRSAAISSTRRRRPIRLPALLAYGAELILVSVRGERRVPYRDFHTAYKKMKLAPDELIRAVCLPRRFAGYVSYTRKVGTRNAQAISKVCIAALARLEGGIDCTMCALRWEAWRRCRFDWPRRSECWTGRRVEPSHCGAREKDRRGGNPAD